MVFAMGPWSSPKYNALEDKRLKQFGAQAHQKIMHKVLEVERLFKITLAAQLYPYNRSGFAENFNTEYTDAIKVAYTYNDKNSGILKMPLLFRSLHSSKGSGPMSTIRASIAPLLNNCLSLPINQTYAGTKPYEDSFFCLELGDDDLPWDITEREW